MKLIPSSDILAFNDYLSKYPIKIDLVYADKNHKNNIFNSDIYKKSANLLGHKDMIKLTLLASEICFNKTGLLFEIKDCLRPVEAQAKMLATDIVQKNIHWTIEPDRLLSPPGAGGHPRGMAVDIILIDKNAEIIDMGTDFDHLSEDRKNNPAARNYKNISNEAQKNRRTLESSMMEAAKICKMDLLPLPQEWWDFRFLPNYTNQFKPINDINLPFNIQMMEHFS